VAGVTGSGDCSDYNATAYWDGASEWGTGGIYFQPYPDPVPGFIRVAWDAGTSEWVVTHPWGSPMSQRFAAGDLSVVGGVITGTINFDVNCNYYYPTTATLTFG